MKKIFIINAHEPYPVSNGKLNSTLVEMMTRILTSQGYEIQTTIAKENYNVTIELEKHQWADVIIIQSPVNWMGMPWTFKRYMDYVYSAGMNGQLCHGDGRTQGNHSKQYGSGGALTGKKYMLSLTFNAPEHAFNDPTQRFFEGKGVDDLFWPMHLNFKFFGMQPLNTFCCYDVVKNPDIDNDFARFKSHLNMQFKDLKKEERIPC